jgi:hypothetical protein
VPLLSTSSRAFDRFFPTPAPFPGHEEPAKPSSCWLKASVSRREVDTATQATWVLPAKSLSQNNSILHAIPKCQKEGD